MMELVRVALRRPYTVAVLSLLVLLLGGLAVTRMVVDFFPKIDIPVVFVGWNYPGLSAEEMERRVIIISERAYSTTVNGIERIESNCIPGIGLVKVYFHQGTDIGASIAQINAINGTILRILPPGITPPVIIQYDPATVPIVQMVLSSKTVSEGRIFDHAFNFVRVRLFTIPGLTVPAPFGGRLRQIMVDLNPQLMTAKGISPNDVVNALQSSNILVPAGTARIGSIEYNVMMNSSPPTVDQFNQMPLRVSNGVPVLLGDVAKVADGFAVQNNIVHVDGRRATYLTILKHSEASSLAVVEATRAMLPEIQKAAPEGIEVKLDFDQSVYVRAAIKNVATEAVIASLLVSLMVLLFLGSWRNTIVVITSIPCAMAAGILGLYFTGNTINLMTLAGLSLATGILVDDATVAVENIHRHRAMGQPLTVAILEGSREVAVPRTMATLAICIVFIPVAFLYGVSKFLFVPLALSVVFSLLASYILSFTLVPMLSRQLLAGEHHDDGTAKGIGARLNRARENSLEWLQNTYGSVLGVIMHHRPFVLVCLLLMGGVSVFLGRIVGTDFFPTADVGILKLHFRAPMGIAHRGNRETRPCRAGGNPQGHSRRGNIDHQRHDRSAAILQSRVRAYRQHQRHGCRHSDFVEASTQVFGTLDARTPGETAAKISRIDDVLPERRHRHAGAQFRSACSDRRADPGCQLRARAGLRCEGPQDHRGDAGRRRRPPDAGAELSRAARGGRPRARRAAGTHAARRRQQCVDDAVVQRHRQSVVFPESERRQLHRGRADADRTHGFGG